VPRKISEGSAGSPTVSGGPASPARPKGGSKGDLARDRRGAGPIGCLLRIVVLAAAVYVGLRFAAPYLDAWRFEDAMKTQAETAEVNADSEIRSTLMQTAADLGISLRPADLRIQRSRGAITISATWSTEVALPKFRRTLHFQRQISAPVGSQPP
jgi:hypothetical protein